MQCVNAYIMHSAYIRLVIYQVIGWYLLICPKQLVLCDSRPVNRKRF